MPSMPMSAHASPNVMRGAVGVDDAAAPREEPHAERVEPPVERRLERKPPASRPRPRKWRPSASFSAMPASFSASLFETMPKTASVIRAPRRARSRRPRSSTNAAVKTPSITKPLARTCATLIGRPTTRVGQRMRSSARRRARSRARCSSRGRRRRARPRRCPSPRTCETLPFSREHVRPHDLADAERHQQDRREPDPRDGEDAPLRHVGERAKEDTASARRGSSSCATSVAR